MNAQSVIVGSPQDWVAALPVYQQELLQPLIRDGDYASAAATWLNSSGPSDNAPYGGLRAGANLFYVKLLEQIHTLLCTSNGYTQERTELLQQAQAGRSVLITFLAGAVAPHVGASPALLAPAIALTLALVNNAGSDMICATLKDLINDRSDESS
jgi:hypothetical protein